MGFKVDFARSILSFEIRWNIGEYRLKIKEFSGFAHQLLGAQLQEIDKKLVFVTGKGGVGKSTVAVILARNLVEKGKRVLVVELGQKPTLGVLAGFSAKAEMEPQKTSLGFDYSLMEGQSCLTDYVGFYVKMETVANIFLNNRFMKTLIPLAPGLDDLAILGQLTSGIRKHGPQLNYDHIIIDAPSSGAFLSMLKSPQYLSEIVDRGPLNTQSREIFRVLNSSEHCHFVFVTLLEQFPMDELLESYTAFQKDFKTDVTVVANKVLPQLETEGLKPEAFRSFVKSRNKKEGLFIEILKSQFSRLKKLELMTKSLSEPLNESPSCPSLKTL